MAWDDIKKLGYTTYFQVFLGGWLFGSFTCNQSIGRGLYVAFDMEWNGVEWMEVFCYRQYHIYALYLSLLSVVCFVYPCLCFILMYVEGDVEADVDYEVGLNQRDEYME